MSACASAPETHSGDGPECGRAAFGTGTLTRLQGDIAVCVCAPGRALYNRGYTKNTETVKMSLKNNANA